MNRFLLSWNLETDHGQKGTELKNPNVCPWQEEHSACLDYRLAEDSGCFCRTGPVTWSVTSEHLLSQRGICPVEHWPVLLESSIQLWPLTQLCAGCSLPNHFWQGGHAWAGSWILPSSRFSGRVLPLEHLLGHRVRVRQIAIKARFFYWVQLRKKPGPRASQTLTTIDFGNAFLVPCLFSGPVFTGCR